MICALEQCPLRSVLDRMIEQLSTEQAIVRALTENTARLSELLTARGCPDVIVDVDKTTGVADERN
jgi:hypothetical protein